MLLGRKRLEYERANCYRRSRRKFTSSKRAFPEGGDIQTVPVWVNSTMPSTQDVCCHSYADRITVNFNYVCFVE